MKIGIPRALLYYRYADLWKKFFEVLNIETVLSPNTDKDLLRKGLNLGIDESCLSGKIYLGHVDYLLDKCDYVFIPRISYFSKIGFMCTKFRALYDVCANTFRDRKIKLLSYNVDAKRKVDELQSFLEMKDILNKSEEEITNAYNIAKKYDEDEFNKKVERQQLILKNLNNKLKILIVGHSYNVEDNFIGKPVIDYLLANGCYPIYADNFDRISSKEAAEKYSPTLRYEFNKELLGATFAHKDEVDGIILITAFPCGPDSMTNDMIIRSIKDKPIVNLIIDEQEGIAGRETRLESFIDILKLRKGDKN